MIIGDSDRDALENCASSASIHRSECMCVVKIGVPTRNHPVFADKDKLGWKRVCPVADTEGGGTIPDDPGRVRALGVTRAAGNHDDVRIRETRRGRAIFKILGRNSRPVVNDVDRFGCRVRDPPRVYDVLVC